MFPISKLQNDLFPGTEVDRTSIIDIGPLNSFIDENTIAGPALLKLDVQGFEFEALLGCESILSSFEAIYCECSFVELYHGQKLAYYIIDFLKNNQFDLKGIYNSSYDKNGKAIQSDFFFTRNNKYIL